MPPLLIKRILAEDTFLLRHSVLWPDKPFDYVKLPDDAEGQHFGGFLQEKLIAVISLFIDNQTNTARFRKFATQPDCQNQGIGTQLLTEVIEQTRQAGATELWCDARLTAAAFYERFGMQAEGEIFYKGEIAYSRFVIGL